MKLQNIKTGEFKRERLDIEGFENSLTGISRATEQIKNEMIKRGYNPYFKYVVGMQVCENIAKKDPDNTCMEFEDYRYTWHFEEQ